MYYYKIWNLLNEVPSETEKGSGCLESEVSNQEEAADSFIIDKRLSFYPIKYLLKFLIQ